MRNRSTVPIALAGAILLASLTLSPTLAQKGPGDPEPPITLRLLVGDSRGRQSEPAALDVVDFAEQLTDGAITIVPAFDGGDVATAVMTGETELGMLPSRDWDGVGVTSLDVLEAPFLIDNDALALSVATSDIADRAMAGLDAVGVTGLAMWPEDLRHLFALDPSAADFSTPDGLVDTDVLVVAGQPGHDLITQLGGRIFEEGVSAGDLTGSRDIDAATGTLEGMVTGLKGVGLPTQDVTVAGDLVVYSKYQMLVANAAMLDGLTKRQLELLEQVVSAAHEAALVRHFTEAELALERCEAGGTVVSIGADAVEAFEAAARPLTERLAADPVTGELMAAVQALKQQTSAAPGAGTCEARAADPRSSPSVLSPGPDEGFVGDRPVPDGTYRIQASAADLEAAGASPDYAAMNEGTWTWTIAGARWEARHDARDEHCAGNVEVADGVVRFHDVVDAGCGMGYEVRWRPAPEGIELRLSGVTAGATEAEVQIERSLVDRVWTRVSDAPSSAAPDGLGIDGIYRAR